MLLLLSVFGLDRRSAFSISHSLVGSTKLTVYKTHNGSIQLRRSARTQQLARAAREVRSLSPFSRPWQAVTILSSCQPVGGKDDGERQQKENGGGGWGSKSFVFLKSKRTWTIRYRRTERYNNKKKGKLFHRKLMRFLSPPDCAEDSYFPPPSVSRVTSRTANQLEMCRFGNDSPGSDGWWQVGFFFSSIRSSVISHWLLLLLLLLLLLPLFVDPFPALRLLKTRFPFC